MTAELRLPEGKRVRNGGKIGGIRKVVEKIGRVGGESFDKKIF